MQGVTWTHLENLLDLFGESGVHLTILLRWKEYRPAQQDQGNTRPAKTAIQTRSKEFLGTCSYYRRFVEGFVKVTTPLHQTMEPKWAFTWNWVHGEAFKTLKAALCVVIRYFTKILTKPDRNYWYCIVQDTTTPMLCLEDRMVSGTTRSSWTNLRTLSIWGRSSSKETKNGLLR